MHETNTCSSNTKINRLQHIASNELTDYIWEHVFIFRNKCFNWIRLLLIHMSLNVVLFNPSNLLSQYGSYHCWDLYNPWQSINQAFFYKDLEVCWSMSLKLIPYWLNNWAFDIKRIKDWHIFLWALPTCMTGLVVWKAQLSKNH